MWLDVMFLILLGMFAVGVLAIEVLNALAKHNERPRRKELITGIKAASGCLPLVPTRFRRRLFPFFQ